MNAREKAQCVEWYIQSKSDIAVQRTFRRRYGRRPPSRNSIRAWYDKFMLTGSLQHLKGNGRPKIQNELIENVQQLFLHDPRKSVRCAARELNLSKSSIHRILKKNLNMKAYKLQILQQITPDDKLKRKHFAITVLDRLFTDKNFLKKIVFSDEATFHVCGKVNKHNVRIWGTEKPYEVREHIRDSPKLNVWCAISYDRLIGPFFFQEKSINGNIYLDMLENFAYPQLEDLQPNVIFQQDGAPPHWKLFVRESLDHTFPFRWIGRDGPIRWPPRSPDLTPCDFFVWGFIKDQVYKTEVSDVRELRQRINAAFTNITDEMRHRVWAELDSRIDYLFANNGNHVENH